MTNTWKLYESMCEARAEIAAEVAEDRPADEVLEQLVRDSEARWDFIPGQGIPEYDERLKEQHIYLESIERMSR